MKRMTGIWRFLRATALAVLTAGLTACELFETDPVPRGWNEGGSGKASREEHGARIATESTRKVLILYSAGYNTLRSYLKSDIEDLWDGYLPGPRAKDDIMLVFSHLNAKPGDYTIPSERYLFRLMKDLDGKVVADTLLRLPHAAATTGEALSEVLTYVQNHFPARSYGMIFSSHASGWLPPGYYANPEDKYSDSIVWNSYAPRKIPCYGSPSPHPWPEEADGPAVKSVGQEQIGSLSYEMSLREFAEACPIHFDYILFDACLMGGVEVAYEFKDICDQIGFSQAEVLAEGFNYSTLTHHLLEKDDPDPVSVCRDYFESYDKRTGNMRSATISMIDCTALEPLADICKALFEKYRVQLSAVNPDAIQNFGRKMSGYDHRWYFDLKDVLEKSGASAEDLAALQEALDGCIVYKAATPRLLGTIDIRAFSGFTVHLPAFGTDYLNNYYKQNVSWNDATSLVL